MTAEELRRLAEIAGLELQYSKLEGWYWYEENYNHTPWRPHESIEQAMMVADTFDYYELGKDMSSAAPYYCQIFTGIGGRLIGQAISMNLTTAICVAALAAAKEV